MAGPKIDLEVNWKLAEQQPNGYWGISQSNANVDCCDGFGKFPGEMPMILMGTKMDLKDFFSRVLYFVSGAVFQG